MYGGIEAYESVARSIHDETGIDAPVSAFDLAGALALRCLPDVRGHAFLDGEDIHYDGSTRLVKQHGDVVHEIAHYVLRENSVLDTEPAVAYTAGALMLPRGAFDRDLRATGWKLDQLRARHPNVSAQMIARRVTELRPAIITVLDQNRVTARVASPWIDPLPQLTALERELADAALVTGEMQSVSELLYAYPLIDGPHRRVILIADAEQMHP